MSRSALQASSTNVQSVAVDGQIGINSIKLRFGRDLGVNNGSIVIKSCGYYSVEASVTIQPSAVGPVGAKLQYNGADIPGAVAYGYAAVEDQNVTLNLSSIVRVVCNNGCPCESIPDTVSIVLIEGPGNVTSVLAEAVKL